MKKIVVLTGAGMSAESGLKTFRDSDGLWENHNVYDVATPEAWERDPEMVLKFYNERRKQVRDAMLPWENLRKNMMFISSPRISMTSMKGVDPHR